MPTKEEFIEKGYVYFGYISPELSSHDEYPDYIRATAEECVEKVQKAHPDVDIFCANVDAGLTDGAFITPGFGDVGGRIFGTK